MTRTGRPRPPEAVACSACSPGRRCPEHVAPRQKLNGFRQTPICPSCGKTPCRPSCPKYAAPPEPSSIPPARLPGGRPKDPSLDAPLAVALTSAATFYEAPPSPRLPPLAGTNATAFYDRLKRLQAIERAASHLCRLWEEAPLGTTSAAAVAAAEAELRRVVRST